MTLVNNRVRPASDGGDEEVLPTDPVEALESPTSTAPTEDEVVTAEYHDLDATGAVTTATGAIQIVPPAVEPAAAPPRPSKLDWVIRSGAVQPAANVLAVVALVLLVSRSGGALALVPASAAAVLPLLVPKDLRSLLRGLGPTGSHTIGRVVLVLVAAGLAPAAGPLLWTAAALLATAILLEPLVARVSRSAIAVAAHLPGVRVRNAGPFQLGRLFFVDTVASLGVGAGVPLGAPWPVVGLLAIAPLVVVATAGVEAGLRVRARLAAEATIPDALAAHGPVFALHWDAPPETEYQVTMWLPYLQRIGAPFVVVVRNARTFAAIADATDAPVLLRRDPRDLDAVVVPSLRAVFYVNNAARNTHFVRFTGLTHIQLNHGESDKAPSYSPVMRMYDRDFVAGQAAIDRFARAGVATAPDLFTIVGRPQIEHIAVATTTSDSPTALYAPTWGGHNADSDYCSLPLGHAIVTALLDRGYTVIYRPHPYTDKNPAHAHESQRIHELLTHDTAASGRPHRHGAAATADMTLVDCFNAADLLVSDISSVVPDFLYSEKPFAISAMRTRTVDFVQAFPIAEAAYVISGSGRNIDVVLDRMTHGDPMRSTRLAKKSYFLGDFPAEAYADGFLAEARRSISA